MIAPTPISVEFSDSNVTAIGCEFSDGNATAITCLFTDDNATAISVEFRSRFKPSKKTDIYLGEGYIGDRISNRLI